MEKYVQNGILDYSMHTPAFIQSNERTIETVPPEEKSMDVPESSSQGSALPKKKDVSESAEIEQRMRFAEERHQLDMKYLKEEWEHKIRVLKLQESLLQKQIQKMD